MVELPLYVKKRTKPNGRIYHHYERYRGTPRAWPRLLLPTDAQTKEFWQRCEQYDRLQAEFAEGAWTFTYRDKHGGNHPLPDPKAGILAFWEALDRADINGARRAAGDLKTFDALVDAYRDHEAYKSLAPNTRLEYDRYLGAIKSCWGHTPVREMTPVDAQAAVDQYQDRPAAGRFFRAVLSRLIAWGIPRGFSDSNAAEKTEKVGGASEPYKPWPEWAFELFFEHARIGLHLPVYSALYTGQRSIDVLGMMRPKSDAQAIELTARKTGANVWVPIHSEYRSILKAAHADHVNLHLREDGEAWTLAGFRTAWQRELTFGQALGASPSKRAVEGAAAEREADPTKATAMARIREAGMVFHGLRKNAVNMLLEAGCTEAEVSNLLEMSEQMVRHYSQDVNARRLAQNAMLKLEAGWSQSRQKLFGGSINRLLENAGKKS